MALSKIFGKDHPIVSHMIKIGWRNTVGRAFPFAGKFVAHLVAARANAANYQTVYGLVEQLKGLRVKAKALNSADKARARRLAAEYLRRLLSDCPTKA